MCEFCKDYHTNYLIPIRNAYADDNICEKLRDKNCEDCSGCADENFHFTLYHSAWNDMISLGFHWVINDSNDAAVISQTSEGIFINYCPWCGEKLSKEINDFEKCCVQKLIPTKR